MNNSNFSEMTSSDLIEVNGGSITIGAVLAAITILGAIYEAGQHFGRAAARNS